MNILELEKLEQLLNKPRAFRYNTLSDDIPNRRVMILLGSLYPGQLSTETPRNYLKFKRIYGKGTLIL
jgi:hypothetical protein